MVGPEAPLGIHVISGIVWATLIFLAWFQFCVSSINDYKIKYRFLNCIIAFVQGSSFMLIIVHDTISSDLGRMAIVLLRRLISTLIYILGSWMAYYFLISFTKDVYRRRRVRKSSPKWVKWAIKISCVVLAISKIVTNIIAFVEEETLAETTFNFIFTVWVYFYLSMLLFALLAELQFLKHEIYRRKHQYSNIYHQRKEEKQSYHLNLDTRLDSNTPIRLDVVPHYNIDAVLDPHHANLADAMATATTIHSIHHHNHKKHKHKSKHKHAVVAKSHTTPASLLSNHNHRGGGPHEVPDRSTTDTGALISGHAEKDGGGHGVNNASAATATTTTLDGGQTQTQSEPKHTFTHGLGLSSTTNENTERTTTERDDNEDTDTDTNVRKEMSDIQAIRYQKKKLHILCACVLCIGLANTYDSVTNCIMLFVAASSPSTARIHSAFGSAGYTNIYENNSTYPAAFLSNFASSFFYVTALIFWLYIPRSFRCDNISSDSICFGICGGEDGCGDLRDSDDGCTEQLLNYCCYCCSCIDCQCFIMSEMQSKMDENAVPMHILQANELIDYSDSDDPWFNSEAFRKRFGFGDQSERSEENVMNNINVGNLLRSTPVSTNSLYSQDFRDVDGNETPPVQRSRYIDNKHGSVASVKL